MDLGVGVVFREIYMLVFCFRNGRGVRIIFVGNLYILNIVYFSDEKCFLAFFKFSGNFRVLIGCSGD